MNRTFDQIADGLAEQGFAIVENFLSLTEVETIINLPEFKKHQEFFKKAGVGNYQSMQINEAIRGDYIHWIDPATAPSALKPYLDRLNDLIPFINQALFLSLKDYEVHMTVYPAGTFYKRHLDQFQQSSNRKLSIICYLNKDWKTEYGGQLRMYLPNSSLDILPVAGKLVCFRSDTIEHEVLPSTRERLSLTGWILDQFLELKHL